jgi:ribosome-binding protein aMBF1 (putative translation factor)
MPDKPYKPPYEFSTHIGAACARKMVNFQQLADKLKIDVTDLMHQCNAKASPSKALVKGLARELDINQQFLDKLAEEVRKDLS